MGRAGEAPLGGEPVAAPAACPAAPARPSTGSVCQAIAWPSRISNSPRQSQHLAEVQAHAGVRVVDQRRRSRAAPAPIVMPSSSCSSRRSASSTDLAGFELAARELPVAGVDLALGPRGQQEAARRRRSARRPRRRRGAAARRRRRHAWCRPGVVLGELVRDPARSASRARAPRPAPPGAPRRSPRRRPRTPRSHCGDDRQVLVLA